jgi:fatty acid desaturase
LSAGLWCFGTAIVWGQGWWFVLALVMLATSFACLLYDIVRHG